MTYFDRPRALPAPLDVSPDARIPADSGGVSAEGATPRQILLAAGGALQADLDALSLSGGAFFLSAEDGYAAETVPVGGAFLAPDGDGILSLWRKDSSSTGENLGPAMPLPINLEQIAALTSVANLTSLAGLSAGANQMPYFSGSGMMALTGLTSQARTLLSSTAMSVSGDALQATLPLRGSGAQNLPAMTSASGAGDTGEVTTNDRSAVLASSLSRSSANRSLAGACSGVDISGVTSAAFALDMGTISGTRSAGIASWRCDVVGPRNLVAASLDSVCDAGSQAAIIASRGVRNDVSGSLAMGNGFPTSTQDDASTANRTIHLFGQNGSIEIAGSVTSGHNFSDFAEMFPNETGVEIPLGTIVTEEGGAVRPAGAGDEIAGVVTATAVVTAGDTPFAWQGRYLSDEWGQPIMEEIADPDHEGDGPAPLIETRKENPAWNPAAPQTPRSERPDEWTRVGLLGQVFTRVAEGVVPGDKLSAVDGIGVKSTARTGLRCMTLTQPYDAAKGYAVARCLINIQV